MTERNIHVVVRDTGAVDCTFTGEHITKREFDRVVRILTKKYSEGIRLFRQSRKVEENGKRTGETGAAAGTASSEARTASGSTGSSGIPQTAKPVVTAAVTTNPVKAS